MRNCAKVGSDIVKKFAKDSGIVDDDTAGILEGVADGVKNQAEADRDASVTDRLKMASKSSCKNYALNGLIHTCM